MLLNTSYNNQRRKMKLSNTISHLIVGLVSGAIIGAVIGFTAWFEISIMMCIVFYFITIGFEGAQRASSTDPSYLNKKWLDSIIDVIAVILAMLGMEKTLLLQHMKNQRRQMKKLSNTIKHASIGSLACALMAMPIVHQNKNAYNAKEHNTYPTGALWRQQQHTSNNQ